MEKNSQNFMNTMENNESLKPIAELYRLTLIVNETAEKAEEVAKKLSVFACKAENAQENLPPVVAWMELCDIYKNSARAFADMLYDSISASRIPELKKHMEKYTKTIISKMSQMIDEDDEFREQLEEAIRKRDGKAENDAKDDE